MREKKRGQGVVEVSVWFVGEAEGAIRQDVRTIGEVEASGVKGSETGFEQAVGIGEGDAWAEQAKAGEQDIVGGLEARRGEGKDVFWGEEG